MSDEFFDEKHVNSASRDRIFSSDLPKCAGPMSAEFLDETYVNSTRRNRFFFSDLPKYASPPGDNFFDEKSSRANSIFFFRICTLLKLWITMANFSKIHE